MKQIVIGAVAALLLVLGLGGAYYYWRERQAPEPPPESVAEAGPESAQEAPEPPLPPASQPPAVQHPVEPPPGLPPLPPAGETNAYVNRLIAELLGRPAVLGLLAGDGLVQRFVTTVDNLPGDIASSRFWPVNPTPERFLVETRDGRTVVSPRNAARYAPFVRLAESLDAAKAAALYAHLYPLFQTAYEELGYPGQYFNDRLIKVIDHLLAAPEPNGPVELTLTQVQGPIASLRPWVRYEYVDENLQSRSAGQRLMVRMGLDNERRLKAKLRELRTALATLTPAR